MPVAKARRRRFRRYLKGKVTIDLSLGSLASNSGVTASNGDVLTEKAWLSSVVLTHAMSKFTAVSDDGPVIVGVAHSDYSIGEIEEWVENQGGWEEADEIGQEIAKRKIREVGMFAIPEGATGSGTVMLNDGKPIHTKCGWMLTTGQTLRVWAYNTGTGALTTNPSYHPQGHANLWPA